jgi:hypothetical protein
MSETRFFGNFPSFAFKALAKILGRGFQLHTSKTYATDPGSLRVNYLRTTRGHYVGALGLRAATRSGLPQVLSAVDPELREDTVEVAFDRSDRDALGVRDLAVRVTLVHERDDRALRRGEAGRGQCG